LFVSKQVGNDEIYAMDEDGSNVVRLTYNSVPDGRATWSANGQHIAFASGATGTRDIFVMNANGSGLRNITNTPEADEDWPDWSPKGNRIIFSSTRDGNHEIYVTDLDAEQTTRLTSRTEIDKWPAWSGCGSKIAFQSNAVGASTDIFVMDADGSNLARLTDNAALDQMPTWSPDMKIAFMSNRNGKPQIFVMDQYGEGEVAINNLVGARPSWSRDGEWIVFTGGDGFPSTAAAYELYKMKNDGTNVIRLTTNSWNDDYPFIK
jgi:TolB protein